MPEKYDVYDDRGQKVGTAERQLSGLESFVGGVLGIVLIIGVVYYLAKAVVFLLAVLISLVRAHPKVSAVVAAAVLVLALASARSNETQARRARQAAPDVRVEETSASAPAPRPSVAALLTTTPTTAFDESTLTVRDLRLSVITETYSRNRFGTTDQTVRYRLNWSDPYRAEEGWQLELWGGWGNYVDHFDRRGYILPASSVSFEETTKLNNESEFCLQVSAHGTVIYPPSNRACAKLSPRQAP